MPADAPVRTQASPHPLAEAPGPPAPGPWQVAGADESALLAPEAVPLDVRHRPGRRPGQRAGRLGTAAMGLVLFTACFGGTVAGTMASSSKLAAKVAVSKITVTHQAVPQAAPPVHAVLTSAREDLGARMLDWAEAHALNHSYGRGGTGPSVYDCSGLVYASAVAAGARGWPRDTYGIAAQIGHRFVVVSRPARGDLALWGSISAPYHVEFITSVPGWNYGAETYGWAGRVTWHDDAYWKPSFYLRILY